MASNLATGVRPSIHGIVGEAWMSANRKQTPVAGTSLSANLADVLTQEWDESPLVVSVSASESLASVFAAHSKVAGSNSYGVKLQGGAFASIYSSTSAAPFAIDNNLFENLIQSHGFSSFLGATSNGDQFTVSVGDTQVTLNAADSVDGVLFKELAFVHYFVGILESDSRIAALVADASPDFYAITFSSLKSIKEKHGEDSDAFAAAMMLVDHAIKQVVAKMDKLYNNKAVTAIVCLNTRVQVSDALKRSVFEKVGDSLRNPREFDTYFPSLYVTGDLTSACDELRDLESESVTVHCLPQQYSMRMEEAAAYSVSSQNCSTNCTTNCTIPNNCTDCTAATNCTTTCITSCLGNTYDVSAFWIFFFLTIAILAWILGGVYLLCAVGVDASKDSLLFRATGRQHQN